MKENRIIIVQGSARSTGDTYTACAYVSQSENVDLIDLNTLSIGQFDYEFRNESDDFYPTISNIISHYDTIIFATPVYWYTMSGIMKAFLDRISDLLKIHKDTGRKLRGMNMGVLSISNDDDLIEGFYMPFVESANYLGMHYVGHCHVVVSGSVLLQDSKERLNKYLEQIK